MIHAQKIEVRYKGSAGDVTALQPTTLTFSKGKFTVLLGRSGAGKSSMLRTLNYLTPPSSGELHVDGIGRINTKSSVRILRRQTGMIFQHHQLLSRETALRNVLNGRLGYHGFFKSIVPLPRKERLLALDCLDRVGLFDKGLRRADQLSGGEQQRVGVARALAQEPMVLLADEPVASLDPATAHELLTLLKRISIEDKITTVVSLHQVDLARTFADRIIGLSKGRVVFDGPPADLDDDILSVIYQSIDGAEVDSAPDDDPATFSPAEMETNSIDALTPETP